MGDAGYSEKSKVKSVELFERSRFRRQDNVNRDLFASDANVLRGVNGELVAALLCASF